MLGGNKNSGVSIFACEPISHFIDKMKKEITYFLLSINLFSGELENFEKYITNEFEFLLIYSVRGTNKSRVFDIGISFFQLHATPQCVLCSLGRRNNLSNTWDF